MSSAPANCFGFQRETAGCGHLYIDGRLVGRAEWPPEVPLMLDMPFAQPRVDIGSPSFGSDAAPAPSSGTVHRVVEDPCSCGDGAITLAVVLGALYIRSRTSESGLTQSARPYSGGGHFACAERRRSRGRYMRPEAVTVYAAPPATGPTSSTSNSLLAPGFSVSICATPKVRTDPSPPTVTTTSTFLSGTCCSHICCSTDYRFARGSACRSASRNSSSVKGLCRKATAPFLKPISSAALLSCPEMKMRGRPCPASRSTS